MKRFKLDRQTRLSIRAAFIIAAVSLGIGLVNGCVRGPTWGEVLNMGMKIGQCVSDSVDFGKFVNLGDAGADAATDAGADSADSAD